MTAEEVYELTTHGGATDFARVVAACQKYGACCLIGGLAVNTYVEPVYTLDARLVVASGSLDAVAGELRAQDFTLDRHPHSVNALGPGSQLRIQFTTDSRYQDFLARAIPAVVLGVPVPVASLQDTAQGKLWAYSDPHRRFSKRKKDELDLIRLLESWPHLRSLYPPSLLELIDRG